MEGFKGMGDNPYNQGLEMPVISVRWPHGGWIVWNWITHKWDHLDTRPGAVG